MSSRYNSLDSPESTELENALTRAVEFAANFKKQGKFKKETRTEREHREKLAALESELLESKKQVIRDVVRVRKLEHALQQSTLSGDAIRRHVQVLPTLSNHKKRHRIKTKWVTESDLLLLDTCAHLLPGTAAMLQRSVHMYNDAHLTQELNAFPDSQLSSMTMLLFSKVAWISSGRRVSLTEGSGLFEEATAVTTLLLRRRPSDPFDRVRWAVLKRMLRAMLRLRHLALSLLSHEMAPPPRPSRRTHTGHEPQSSSPSPSPSRKITQRQSFSRTTRADPLAAPLAGTLPHLSKQLQSSQRRQEGLERKIQSTLSAVSRSVPLGAMKSANQFARKSGANKVMGILLSKVLGYSRIVLDRLHRNVTLCRAEEKAATFLRLYGSYRMCEQFDMALQEKIHRHFLDWSERIQNLKEMEEWAAALEIQRVGRGCIGRFNVRNRHRITAAKNIQRIVRGGLDRKQCRKLAYERRLKWAVQVVEAAWKGCKWQRTLKYLLILRKQTRAGEFIQRVFRGHRARNVARARRLKRRQHIGAIKLQCLWRRYEAICMVVDYYSRWKQVEGAITIQARVRGVQGRARARRVRRWYISACTIQRAVRCRIARDKVRHRRRELSALLIQRRWRGYMARKRVFKLLDAKRKARAEADYALNCIIKIIRGCYIRRKWRPVIEEYTAKRVEAMQRIKTRYKAVKVGNEARKHLAHLSKAVNIITRTIRRFIALCSDRARRERLEYDSATSIQAAWRGVLGREVFAKYAHENRQRLDMRMPIYYRLQKMYLRDQNAFHAKHVIKIQCLVRRVAAKQLVQAMRIQKTARFLQHIARKYIERQRARDIVHNMRHALYYQDRMATRIQKVHRGNLGRYQASKHKKADILKWFLGECKQVGMLKRCCINFRCAVVKVSMLRGPYKPIHFAYLYVLFTSTLLHTGYASNTWREWLGLPRRCKHLPGLTSAVCTYARYTNAS